MESRDIRFATEALRREAARWRPVASRSDQWRLDEWNALPDVCFVHSCEASETDPRGPVWFRDGSMHKACQEHWECVHQVLGEQAGSNDAYRQGVSTS